MEYFFRDFECATCCVYFLVLVRVCMAKENDLLQSTFSSLFTGWLKNAGGSMLAEHRKMNFLKKSA